MMGRFIVLGLVVLTVTVFGFSLIDGGSGDVDAETVLSVRESDTSGFARAIDPREWNFPRDHGSHNDFQTEWWYFTGNLQSEDGRPFGFQFTIFRRAIAAPTTFVSTDSEWRSNQVYMAHFSVSDIGGGRFYHEERYSRGGANLAGALPDDAEPGADLRIWLEGWEIVGLNDDATQMQIVADAGDFGVDFVLDAVKPIALQGVDGLSQKSDEPGNASYYYSFPRMVTEGTVRIGAETFTVSGLSWFDREFSTSALGEDAQGWDWFALHLDDGRDLVVGQIRLKEGGRRSAYTGTIVYEDGSTYHLNFDEYDIQPTDTWESPHTGAVYPSGWTITIAAEAMRQEEDLVLTLTPLMRDQELHSGDIAYWEGAVAISGGATGLGYAELTGYTDAISGRF
ncbi:MAG: lipocalin-like domain-containing protein [bacterium]|nr:lipocalin-like domain-containing protein [bacterium]